MHEVVARDEDPERIRLPRSRGFSVSMPAIVQIGLTATALVMILATRRPCSDAVSGFVTGFDSKGSGSGSAAPTPAPGESEPRVPGSAGDYETLRPDMTEAELKAAIERAKARASEQARAKAAAGSGSGGSPAP
jgi:hypothetical protein